ncbi:hypothetical protein EDD95_1980 [Streptomyces sp. CEV 2-1]|nr:hypothetical protein EDD95_1980 [Streptomyces sp. CEV 2-1]
MRTPRNAAGGGTGIRGDPVPPPAVRDLGPIGVLPGARRTSGQAAGACHWAQLMFQPLSPLSGWIVLSGEFFMMTTSPIMELS